jgi:hypothetical protein
MQLCRLIAPPWLAARGARRTLEGLFTEEQLVEKNLEGYNVYYWANHPEKYEPDHNVDGRDIDCFSFVFIDHDTKVPGSLTKNSFVEKLLEDPELLPTKIIDSGNGIHAYWYITDLDAKSYLRLTRRLMRRFDTDPAVGTLAQLMRLPGTLNTKVENNFILCDTIMMNSVSYTCEQLDKLLSPITIEDEEHCTRHYNSVFNSNTKLEEIDEVLPAKFGQLLEKNVEAKELWSSVTDDRSKSDYRLAHIMYANGFTRQEAASVLINSAKALTRKDTHRTSYASNIIDKIWTYELADKTSVSPTVREVLQRSTKSTQGTRFPCNRLVDDTEYGYRLGQVKGIVGGSGVGKTTLTLNEFLWFAENNPDYHHFFFSLEQPSRELAERIKRICGGNEGLYDKIHIVSNYNEDGTYNHFSMQSIETLLENYQNDSKNKVGAVVIDHIGVLAKDNKNGESDGLIGICRHMKETAVKLNIFLIMLSQAPREKAGVGDLELNKDAAYGTVFFESFVDYLVCMWQPLKRAYAQGAPTVMAVKFAKIRHKRQGVDRIQEDVCYQFYFDPATERLREMTQSEEIAAKHYLTVATNARKVDRKTDIIPYVSRRLGETIDSKTSSN